MELHLTEIIEATRGKLIAGSPDSVITGIDIDSRKTGAGSLFIPLQGNRHDGHSFIGAACDGGATAALIRSGHSLKADCRQAALIAVDDPLTSLGDIARLWRAKHSARVAVITGSNGKTTTKEMVWSIISDRIPAIKNPGNWNNLIGLPLSLLQLESGHRAAVLEIGMSEPGEIKRLAEISRPSIGLITNVGPSHLEQLHTLEGVQAAKAELFTSLGTGETAIVNNDDPRVAALAGRTQARTVSFGIGSGDIKAADIRGCNCFGSTFDLVLRQASITVNLQVPGRECISNALGAAAIACELGLDAEDIKRGLESFRGVPGRMEMRTMQGISIINDSYNANPASMQASLRVLADRPAGRQKIAVLGDMLELGPRAALFHRELGQTAASMAVDYIFVTGDFSSHVRDGALAAGMQGNRIVVCNNLETVAEKLKTLLHEGDSVLLKGSRKMQMEKVLDLLQPP